ncbi:unnamed protein product [Trichogramma brassicae]|uniref:Reverse transcriptase domain-containing protein n=1 Tax=Trichogramma brassicae TaxID=86971 RepID=A0A6H5IFL5_9HYME|nr:unnamed protein product [Trichogramma brassicae]
MAKCPYEYLQATSVLVEDGRGPITFSAINCPPGRTIKQEQFTSWGSRSPTPSPRGRQLYETLEKENYTTISTGEPTYWPSDLSKRPDLIDFAVTKDRTFHVKIKNEITSLYEIHAGVPQGSVLGPTLYLLYTADLPSSENVTIATYADDTALLCSHQCPVTASSNLQKHISKVETWYKSWRIKVNETKSIHTTFTLCTKKCPSVFLNGINIPQDNVVKYLGIHLDRRLTWRSHIWTKRKQLNLKIRKMYWLLGRNSTLTLENKLLLYNSMLKSIWTYSIQLWGAASKSNIEIIERLQSKTLRCLVNAPWFVTNEDIRKDLKVPTVVKEEICKFSDKYKDRLKNHPNSLAARLGSTSFEHSRLKHRGTRTADHAELCGLVPVLSLAVIRTTSQPRRSAGLHHRWRAGPLPAFAFGLLNRAHLPYLRSSVTLSVYQSHQDPSDVFCPGSPEITQISRTFRDFTTPRVVEGCWLDRDSLL